MADTPTTPPTDPREPPALADYAVSAPARGAKKPDIKAETVRASSESMAAQIFRKRHGLLYDPRPVNVEGPRPAAAGG